MEVNLFNDDGQISGNRWRTYILYKSDLQTETYVNLPLGRDHSHILSMYHCGNLPLHIETGCYAYAKIPVEQITCFYRLRALKMNFIFLLNAPIYDDIRRKMLHKAELSNTDL